MDGDLPASLHGGSGHPLEIAPLHGGLVIADELPVVQIEVDREVGGGWYTAGDLVAVQQVPLGTLEPNTPVIRRIRFRKLNWSRDVGIRIRPYQE